MGHQRHEVRELAGLPRCPPLSHRQRLRAGLVHQTQAAHDYAELREFYLRRVLRIFPPYWAAHAVFITSFLAFGAPWLVPISRQTAMTLLALRFTPDTFSYISTAWWYVGLILQLYLVFPLLWAWLRRAGPLQFLAGTGLVTLVARLLTLVVVGRHIELWSMGLLFTNRLFEFAFGMSVAYRLAVNQSALERWVWRMPALAGALACYALGLAASFTVLGSVIAP